MINVAWVNESALIACKCTNAPLLLYSHLIFIDTPECKKECISRKCIKDDTYCTNKCCDCGKTESYDKKGLMPYIIGGQDAKVRYPWMVSINRVCDKNFNLKPNIKPNYTKLPWINGCGASIISSRIIIDNLIYHVGYI